MVSTSSVHNTVYFNALRKLLQESFVYSERSELFTVPIRAMCLSATAFEVTDGFSLGVPSDFQLMLVIIGHACYDVKIATSFQLGHLAHRQHDCMRVKAP